MKSQLRKLAALCLGLFVAHAYATTYYVDINSPNPTPPYTSWSTAATNIQDAVAETFNGDSILVNPGVYQSGGYSAPDGTLTAVDVTNAITIEGVNGEAQTWVNGSNAMRCIYLASGTTLTGFTISNGLAITGGGAYCASTAGTVISNCVITANSARDKAGGTYQGTLFNCTVSQNYVESSIAYGGGAYNAVLINCIVISNSIFGGEGIGVYNSDVTNSLIADNAAIFLNLQYVYQSSEGGGAYGGNLNHCNIVGNTAVTGGGTYNANLVNCINYYNTYDFNGSNSGSSNYWNGIITYTCTAPVPAGTKNIASDPQLASPSHISLASPCRGAGSAAASSGSDIDGNPWANPPSMGCFEPYPGNVLGNLTVAISTPFTNWAPGFALTLQANISGPVYSNVWSFGDGTSITNETYVFHTWTASGTYPITLTAYNDGYPAGIAATQMVFVTVPSVYYVNLNSINPVAPYITWATAAINIQDAVNVAAPGSLVLVTNGPTVPNSITTGGYNITNTAAFYMNGGTNAPDGNFYRVVITNSITVQSVNGPAATYIWGTTPSAPEVNCVYLTNGAILSGFTMTNYSFSQDRSYNQITATSTSALITNCLMAKYVTVNSGTLDNCSLALYSGSISGTLNNSSLIGGYSQNSILNSCIVTNNSQVLGGVLNNCILANNTNGPGGGAALAEQGYPLVLNNCVISNNFAQAGSGGGVYNTFQSTPNYYTNCVLNNCILIRNSTPYEGGAAWGAELNNCLIISNSASWGGGVEGGFLNDCTLIGNLDGGADGSYISPHGAVLTNCTLIANVRESGATLCTLDGCTLLQNVGVGANSSVLNNCLVISNSPASQAGIPTDGGGAYLCKLTNCILAYNAATNGGGAYESTLVNCTVIANSGVNGGGAFDCTNYNSILYRNVNGDFSPNTSQFPLNYCCVSTPTTYGIRNVTNMPLFVAPGNFHLQPSSPCINSGNNAYISNATDLDGNPRIVGGTVDIGAYEYQTPTSVISYAYLQQYGLPTDGSVDFADLDGTAFNVYQDWIAGLNPTNPASVLAMLTPVTTNTATGVIVTWQSVSGIPYFLQRSTNLVSQPPFATIQSNIIGQANTTSYTDTSATNNVPYFYRVGVVAP